MTYPQWWERLLAAIVDGLIFVLVSIILGLVLVAAGGVVLGTILNSLILTGAIIAYKVVMESSEKGATVGKMLFGLRVVGHDGGRVDMQTALRRTWPWWLNVLTILGGLIAVGTLLSLLVAIALIVIFVTYFMDPVGQCIHDQTAKCYVIKDNKGLFAS